jgi:hypothetical protein
MVEFGLVTEGISDQMKVKKRQDMLFISKQKTLNIIELHQNR